MKASAIQLEKSNSSSIGSDVLKTKRTVRVGAQRLVGNHPAEARAGIRIDHDQVGRVLSHQTQRLLRRRRRQDSVAFGTQEALVAAPQSRLLFDDQDDRDHP